MRKIFSFYLILIVVLACSSCSDKQYQVLFEKSSAIADTASQKAAITATVYHIQPQDILQIKNLQDPQFLANQVVTGGSSSSGKNVSDNNSFQVDQDGSVNLPIVGHVQVAGLTRLDAQKLIEGLYRKILLKDPIIELKITSLKVTLLGEIKTQGSFPLVKDQTTLVELIGEAGGLTSNANEKTVKIIRGTQKEPKVTEINLNDITSINDPKAVLQSGDIIYVAQSKRAARNDNLQNFSLLVQPVLLLFNTVLIIFTLTRK